MKKTILSIALALGFGTAHAGWISYDLDHVKADAKGGSDSQAHYIRAGGQAAGLNTMLQARTASFDKGGMVHRLLHLSYHRDQCQCVHPKACQM